jgi:hypothetical protein
MKKTAVLGILLLAACSSEKPAETPKTDTVVTTPETTESAPMEFDAEFRYVITDKKTGKKIELSADEYVTSDYVENPQYTVEERPTLK